MLRLGLELELGSGFGQGRAPRIDAQRAQQQLTRLPLVLGGVAFGRMG